MYAGSANVAIGTTTARATSLIGVVRALARSMRKVRGLTTACRDASKDRSLTEEESKNIFRTHLLDGYDWRAQVRLRRQLQLVLSACNETMEYTCLGTDGIIHLLDYQ
jgi:hypothetical protein